MTDEKINVIVAIDFSDAIMETLHNISPRLNIVRYFPDVPQSAWEDCEVLYTVRHYPEPEQVPRLRWIQFNYAGIERALNKRIVQAEDIILTTVSGIHAQPIANYCLMMMLAFNFQLPRMMREQQQSLWLPNPYEVYKPIDMHRLTVGIVGYGAIGREIARVSHALGMRVLASKRDAKQPAQSPHEYCPPNVGDPQGDIPERIYPTEATALMAQECDFLVVTAPLTPATKHMINEKVFEAMKPTSVLINIARGGLVDEQALISALAAGKIGGAALDVFETEPLPTTSPLWQMENVIISPHISGNSRYYHDKAADVFAENLRRYLDKRPLLNVVNRELGY